jgi:hypothetical protein
MTTEMLDAETIASLAVRLDRLAPEFTDAERTQLKALLAVAAEEVAGRTGVQAEEPEVEAFGAGGTTFSDALRPLIVTTAGGVSLGVPSGGIPGGTRPSGSSGSGGSSSGGKL